MRLSTAVVKYLELNGAEYIFGIPAGTSGPLWDSINDTSIRPIITKNEAGAVYSAANYADVSGNIGIALLAGGVGINNAINGIADAYRRKLPVLILTGYVHRKQIGKGAIQELDSEQIVEPITKFSKTVLDESIILETLKEAMCIAITPPYGPVHLAIPMDIQMLEAGPDIPSRINREELTKFSCTDSLVAEAVEIINNSTKGVIFVGRGCKTSSKEVMALSTKLNWGIVTTPEGKGIIHTDFEYNLGAYGFAGTDLATKYVEEPDIDCVLILGTSLGESATRNYSGALVKNRKVVQVDWDKQMLSKVFKADVAIHDSVENVLTKLITSCNEKCIKNYKNQSLNVEYVCNHTGVSTRLFLEKLPNILPDNYYLTSDIGEYMNFIIKNLPIPKNTGFGISLNYGAMGVAVGGSVGTALANKDKTTVVIVGDGSFFMNGSEILTAKEYNLPIVYCVINNSMLGYVHHGQNYIYGRGIEGVVQTRVSIAAIACAMGIQSVKITKLEELDTCKNMIKDLKGPLVIELITDGTEVPIAADRFKALKNNN